VVFKKTLHAIWQGTFATVTLSNGVSIESVSKMLGHKNLRTTQHYARILDQKVSEDMHELKRKLAKASDSEEELNSGIPRCNLSRLARSLQAIRNFWTGAKYETPSRV
jgi:hypothetical protein